jgi:hypothetical protein
MLWVQFMSAPLGRVQARARPTRVSRRPRYPWVPLNKITQNTIKSHPIENDNGIIFYSIKD